MTQPPAEDPQAEAARTLARLRAETASVRLELDGLRQDLARVQQDFSGKLATQLLEANEQLVLTALRAQEAAQTVADDLDLMSRVSQLDVLTETPNRTVMQDRLESALAMARRRGAHAAVIFVDLDDFKHINDTLGHAVGDVVLQTVARRLASVVRESDTVSRHGGDEFLVLLAEVAQPSDAALIAAKMFSAVAEPTRVGDAVLHLSASLGIAVYPQDGTDAKTLIAHADAAMYRAKRPEPGDGVTNLPVPAPAGTGDEPPRAAPGRPLSGGPESAAQQMHRLHDLRAANERLVVAAVTAQEVEDQVEQMHSRQIKFLALVAHELRNPLNPIRTAAALLQRASGDPALLGRLHKIIERQVVHMSRLVEDLLDGSRVSTGKFRLQHGSVDLVQVLQVAVESCQPVIDRQHQQLSVRLPPGQHTLHGDAERLVQVFTNLLDNASKYSQERGTIELSLALREGAMEVTISDNGIGIGHGSLARIFELFVQGTRAPTVEKRGLGIGLAVVRELVEAHGGSVVATSAGRDLGSQFVVTLPIKTAPSAGSAA